VYVLGGGEEREREGEREREKEREREREREREKYSNRSLAVGRERSLPEAHKPVGNTIGTR